MKKENFGIEFLGVGNALLNSNGIYHSNMVVVTDNPADNLFFDCGSDFPHSLRKAWRSYRDVQNVFISHLHADHVGGHHHHHTICLQCKKVYNFNGCNEDANSLISKALKQNKDFDSISYHSFDLFGICKKCSKNEK